MAFQLAKDGRALSAIVIAKDATQQETYAATELRDYLTQIAGAAFDVETAGESNGKILIGRAAGEDESLGEDGFHLGEAVEGALWGYGAALMPRAEAGQVETELVGGERVVLPAYHLVFLYSVIYYIYYILHGEVVGVAIVVYGAWRVAVPVAIAGREFPLPDKFVTIGVARCVVCFTQLLKFLFLLAHSVFYFFVFDGHIF